MSDQPEPAARPAAEGSPLAGLRARREKKVRKLYTDLPVRGLEPLHVRFRPVGAAEITRVNKRFEKSKADDVEVVINGVLLSQACVGIFDKPDADAEVATSAEWLRFDQQLAEVLGLPEKLAKPVDQIQAVEVVRGLYLTDGDVISTGMELSRWSGYTLDDVERDVSGN